MGWSSEHTLQQAVPGVLSPFGGLLPLMYHFMSLGPRAA